MPFRPAFFGAFALAWAIAACGTASTPATPVATVTPAAPATAAATASASPATDAPTGAPATQDPATGAPATDAPGTVDPAATLDPGQSDAGIVGRVTIPNDTRGERSGTHFIIGREGHGFGTDCSYTFEGDEFVAVAYNDDAEDGQIFQMAVVVPIDSMPANDGEQRMGISDGVVYVDFRSGNGVGTAYTGDADDDNGSSSVNVRVAGDLVIFDYEAVTWDAIELTGQMVCQGAAL